MGHGLKNSTVGHNDETHTSTTRGKSFMCPSSCRYLDGLHRDTSTSTSIDVLPPTMTLKGLG
jgi:hypothetical protein